MSGATVQDVMYSTTPVPPPIAVESAAPRGVTDGDAILAIAHAAASPERVFEALTTKEVELWWGSADTYRVTDWNGDVRVGGRWSLVVVRPDGGTFPASGEFLTVDAPHKFVQTRRYDWDYPGLGRRDTTVTFRLDAVAGETRVSVRHDGFGGLWEAAMEHAAGWERFLGWLVAHVEGK